MQHEKNSTAKKPENVYFLNCGNLVNKRAQKKLRNMFIFCSDNRSLSKSFFFFFHCVAYFLVLSLSVSCLCSNFAYCLLQLLLWPEAVGVTTLLLTAVHGARMETGVAQPEICLKVGFRVKKFSQQPADHQEPQPQPQPQSQPQPQPQPRSFHNLQIILSQLYF